MNSRDGRIGVVDQAIYVLVVERDVHFRPVNQRMTNPDELLKAVKECYRAPLRHANEVIALKAHATEKDRPAIRMTKERDER